MDPNIGYSTLSIHCFVASGVKKIKKPNSDKIEFNRLKGKVILIVNIATKCGYTPQLDGLENLYKKYNNQGLVIIGVPSNDFGGQTPENDKDAAKFCRINYGVSFPISQKYIVSGDKKIDLYKVLIKETNNKLKNKSFLKNAPKQIVQKEKKALINYKIELKKLNSILNSIKN